MTTATIPLEFQDLADGPGELGPSDDGKVPAWSWPDRRLIMIPLPSTERQLIIRAGGGGGGGGGGVTDHADLTNLDYASSGHTGFEPAGTAAAAIADHVAEADPHTQYLLESGYTAADVLTKLLTVDGAGSGLDADLLDGNSSAAFLLATGATTGATSSAQTFTNGIVAPSMRPASDSTTALQLQNAAGTNVLTVDTTNSRVGIGTTPGATLDVAGTVFPVGRFVRKTGTGSSQLSSFGVGLKYINGTPSAGFGPGFVFQAMRDNGLINNLAAFYSRVISWVGTENYGVGALDIAVFNNSFSPTTVVSIVSTGDVGIGTTTPTALLDVADTNAGTGAVQNAVTMRSTNSGTPGAGFGVGFRAGLKSSTTEDQDAGRLTYEWVTATHASRASRGKLTAYYTSTEQTAFTWDGDTGGLKLGFYGVTPVARQVLATGAGASVDDVITALQNLGLVKQS